MSEGNEATPGSIEAFLDSAARACTGSMGVKEAQRRVRYEMLRQALEASGGNRHAMARMLRVDRSYVLKMLRDAGQNVSAVRSRSRAREEERHEWHANFGATCQE